MHTSLTKRIFIGFCFAVPLALLTVAVGEARSSRQEPFPAQTLSTDCQSCHENVVSNWQNSAHGKASIDPRFNQAWKDQGSPDECLDCHITSYAPGTGEWQSDGIACSACHEVSSVTSSHPEQIMPVNVSSELCGTCHVDTFNEWQVSRHGQEEMTCVKCHNPHTTELKVNNVQELCQNCHNEESHFYTFTGHAQQGLLCTDCHLQVADTTAGEAHSQRIHTFDVDLNTCNRCHNQEMHGPMPNSTEQATLISTEASCQLTELEETAGNNAPGKQPTLSSEPKPASFFSFAILAGVIGMAFGIVGSPWLERLYRRSDLNISEVRNEQNNLWPT